MSFSAWPYEEIELHPLEGNGMLFRAPWFSRELQLSEETQKVFQELFERPDDATFSQQADFWRQVFSIHPHDPLFYILPRKSLDPFRQDTHEASLDFPALQSLAKSYTSKLSSPVAERIASQDWDIDAILSLSKIAGTDLFDPLTIFSAARRFYFLDAIDFDQTAVMYEYAGALKGARFRQAAHFIASQNFEVTRRCQEVLRPALLKARSKEETLKEFIDSEKGHDRLLQRGLEKLGAPPAAPLAITSLLLDAFQLVADKNFLAFAFTVSLFEEAAPEGEPDPLTKLMLQGGEHEAAQHFQRHCDINDGGHHDHIGIDLLETMAPVSEAYAIEAIQFCESISKILNSLTTEILSAIRA